MERRNFLGWLAVLPFLRKLPHIRPDLSSLYQPPLTAADIVDAVHPPHYVMCVGDTHCMWGNRAAEIDYTSLKPLLVEYGVDGRIASPNIWGTRT